MIDLGENVWNLAPQPLELYLHYQNSYGHHIWQSGDLTTGTQDHLINKNHYISAVEMPRATKLGRMVSSLEVL